MTPQTITLRRGEARLLHADAGSRWRLLRGAARLAEPPRWLGERIVQLDADLPIGHWQAVDRGGWFTLHALADSVIDLAVPAPFWARWRIIRPAPASRAAARLSSHP